MPLRFRILQDSAVGSHIVHGKPKRHLLTEKLIVTCTLRMALYIHFEESKDDQEGKECHKCGQGWIDRDISNPISYGQYKRLREEIDKNEGGLEAFSRGYEKFGFTQSATGITYREWAPGAKGVTLPSDGVGGNINLVEERSRVHYFHQGHLEHASSLSHSARFCSVLNGLYSPRTPISVFMKDRSSGDLVNIAKYGEEYLKENESPINVLETMSNQTCLNINA